MGKDLRIRDHCRSGGHRRLGLDCRLETRPALSLPFLLLSPLEVRDAIKASPALQQATEASSHLGRAFKLRWLSEPSAVPRAGSAADRGHMDRPKQCQLSVLGPSMER